MGFRDAVKNAAKKTGKKKAGGFMAASKKAKGKC